MAAASWPVVVNWLTVALVVPLIWESARRPRRSGSRLGLAAVAVAILTVDLTTFLHYLRVPAAALLPVLAGGVAVALIMIGFAVRRTIRARRAEREPDVSTDQLITEPARLWVRPHPPVERDEHGPWSRFDAWLAADGPKPSAGWWHNGGLQLDQRGPAFVDAAGLRHPLPASVTGMLNPSVPRSLLLVDRRHTVLVRLPTTGFNNGELKDFAASAGWTYTTDFADYLRDAPDVLDLRRGVVDHLAKEDGAVRKALRRLAGQRE
ncbi:MAG TPA: hypothetical protein VJ914_39550 [Pseudonocardiaceae bacterium]|nr:hypothetical protein [Pseudonocardiaceae bacterium]